MHTGTMTNTQCSAPCNVKTKPICRALCKHWPRVTAVCHLSSSSVQGPMMWPRCANSKRPPLTFQYRSKLHLRLVSLRGTAILTLHLNTEHLSSGKWQTAAVDLWLFHLDKARLQIFKSDAKDSLPYSLISDLLLYWNPVKAVWNWHVMAAESSPRH